MIQPWNAAPIAMQMYPRLVVLCVHVYMRACLLVTSMTDKYADHKHGANGVFADAVKVKQTLSRIIVYIYRVFYPEGPFTT